jgi:hypothetical protein
MQRAKQWFRTKLQQPWSRLSMVEQILAVVVGILGGLFPVPMLTTFVTVVLGKLLTMNAAQIAVATAINFFMTPLEVALIPPLARWFTPITGASSESFTASNLADAMGQGVSTLISVAGVMLLHAILSWAVGTAVLVLALMKLKPNGKGPKILP